MRVIDTTRKKSLFNCKECSRPTERYGAAKYCWDCKKKVERARDKIYKQK